ncbi:hypothetical protein AX16_008535 [Volvariella volvacea WC 439]|nr:hypothetical protein AX16_008535 [Volvariella volvacea WC 439]
MHNSERAPHFSSVFSFSRPDYEASRSKSHLQQAHRLNALPGQGRVLDQEHEYPTSKLGEPIILDPRRIAAPAGMSNGNRPFSVGGNGLGFGFGFGEAHGNTNTNGSSNGNGTSGSNGGTGKKHICPTCSKKFNRPSSLKIHVNTHTGATPFRCPWPNCGREFNVNSNMRRHYRNHGSPGLVRAASEDEDTNARLPEDNVDGNRRRRRQPSNAAFPTVNMDMSFIETIDPSAPNTNSSQKLDLSTNAVPPNGAYTFVVGSGREVLSRKRRKLDDGYVAANQSMASPPPSSSEGDSEDDSEYEQTGPELRGEPLPMHVYEDELRGRSTRTMEYTDSALRTPPRGKHEGNPLHRYTSRSRSRSRSDNNISGPSSFPYSSAASSASSAPSVSLPSTPASASVSPPPSKPMPLSQDGKGRDHLYSPSEPYSKSFVDLHVSTALRPAFGDFDQNRSRSPPDYVQHRQSRREEHNPYPTRVHSPPRRWANGHETKEEW